MAEEVFYQSSSDEVEVFGIDISSVPFLLSIEVEQDQRIIYTGDLITGRIILDVFVESIPAADLLMVFDRHELWTVQSDEKTLGAIADGRANTTVNSIILVNFEDGKLSKGHHVYGFSFEVPYDIPPTTHYSKNSYLNQNAKLKSRLISWNISYSVGARIVGCNIANMSEVNKSCDYPIEIEVSTLTLNHNPLVYGPFSYTIQKKGFFFFRKKDIGQLTLGGSLSNNRVCMGDSVIVKLSIKYHSEQNIGSLKDPSVVQYFFIDFCEKFELSSGTESLTQVNSALGDLYSLGNDSSTISEYLKNHQIKKKGGPFNAGRGLSYTPLGCIRVGKFNLKNPNEELRSFAFLIPTQYRVSIRTDKIAFNHFIRIRAFNDSERLVGEVALPIFISPLNEDKFFTYDDDSFTGSEARANSIVQPVFECSWDEKYADK